MSQCVLMTEPAFEALVSALDAADSNEKKLELLEEAKGWGAGGKLFSCAHLLRCMETTPSTKTKLVMIDCLAPRLTDALIMSAWIVEQFKYADDV